LFGGSTSGYLQMKGRKYGAVESMGAVGVVAGVGVYGERKEDGRGLKGKERARGRREIERSTEKGDTKRRW